MIGRFDHHLEHSLAKPNLIDEPPRRFIIKLAYFMRRAVFVLVHPVPPVVSNGSRFFKAALK